MAGAEGPPVNSTQRDSLNLTDVLLRLASTPRPRLDVLFTSTVPNLSPAVPPHRSGIVPGIIAASLFISFLLCLYAILWKCMVAMPKRQMKRQNRRRHSTGLLPEKMHC